jgi:hypothetical protein
MLIYYQMNSDAQSIQLARELNRRFESRTRGHDRSTGENARPKRLGNSLVYGFAAAEVIGIHDKEAILR